MEKIARRAERWLAKQGYETNEDWDVDESDALPLFQEASIAGITNLINIDIYIFKV